MSARLRYDLRMQAVIIALILYFLALAVLSSMKPVEINWRVAILLRAFFPSWKFFEDYADTPKLFFRIKESDDWRAIQEPIPRKRWNLLLNHHGNQALAMGSLIQQLLFDLQKTKDGAELEKTVSFELIRELVRRKIGTAPKTFQFKLANVINDKHDDILISARFQNEMAET